MNVKKTTKYNDLYKYTHFIHSVSVYDSVCV